MLGGMGLLATLCLLLGVFPTTMIETMAPITQLLVHDALPSAAAQGWLWLTPISPRLLRTRRRLSWLAIVVVFGLGYLFLKRGAVPARRAYAWDCGFGQLTQRMQYTSTAFSQPIRRVFARSMEGRGAGRHRLPARDRFRG